MTSSTKAFSRLCWTPAHEEEQHDAGGHEGSYHPYPGCLRLFVANRQLVFILLRVDDTGMTRKVGKTKDFRFCDADWEPAQRQVQYGSWRKENNRFLTSIGAPVHKTQLIFNKTPAHTMKFKEEYCVYSYFVLLQVGRSNLC